MDKKKGAQELARTRRTTGLSGTSRTVHQVRIGTAEKPEKQPQTSNWRISQTTWNLETKFWGDDEHPKVKISQKIRPLTPYNSRNHKSHASTSRTQKTRKPPKLKAFLRDLRVKITEKRGTPTSCVIPKTNPAKKHLEILPIRIPRKGSENHQERETGETQSSLEEPHRIIYTYHEGSYKV
jgi:hypothetical protein